LTQPALRREQTALNQPQTSIATKPLTAKPKLILFCHHRLPKNFDFPSSNKIAVTKRTNFVTEFKIRAKTDKTHFVRENAPAKNLPLHRPHEK
jgi:hypothetical protein